MTTFDEPQRGDRVRVTTEEVVDENGFYPNQGLVRRGVYSAKVEIIEHADDPANDPANDPIGTIAYHARRPWVKMAGDHWECVDGSQNIRFDKSMRGRIVTGTVPRSPAAVEPQVIHYGDPEPYRGTPLADADGDVLAWNLQQDGWEYQKIGGCTYRWGSLQRRWFPMTVVEL